jgi:hypothetical protein
MTAAAWASASGCHPNSSPSSRAPWSSSNPVRRARNANPSADTSTGTADPNDAASKLLLVVMTWLRPAAGVDASHSFRVFDYVFAR